jgi:UDP-perosamine 4-acetyltransferase
MIARMHAEKAAAGTRIIGLGAGTHAKSVLEAIRSGDRFEVAALLDDDESRIGGDVLGFPISGAAELHRYRADGVAEAFVGVAGIADSSGRRAVFERLKAAGFELPPIVHAAAIVSPWAELGRGAQVLAGAIVNAGAQIGNGAIVNTGAIVEHDCQVGAHAHVAPGARLAGLVSVGTGAHVGIGAVLIEAVEVGEEALVGAGAVVLRDVPAGTRVAGVPARPLE